MKMPLGSTVAYIGVMVVLVILISMLLALNISQPVPPIIDNGHIQEERRYFILDGMTCVVVGEIGISCDWDKSVNEAR